MQWSRTLIALWPLACGCGASFQTYAGLFEVRSRTVSKVHELEVVGPEGAQIYRRENGERRPVGTSPVLDQIEYTQVETVEANASMLPLLLGGALDLGLLVVAGLLAQSDEEDRFLAPPWPLILGTYGGAALVGDLIFGGILASIEPKVLRATPLGGGTELVYGVQGGRETRVRIPEVRWVKIPDPPQPDPPDTAPPP